MTGIYKITSPSKRVYIGQSINIEERFYNYKLMRCKSQTKLYNSFKKYGVENHKFEILCECTVDELNDQERYFQEIFNTTHKKYGMNCILVKSSNRSGEISEEMKLKLRLANLGKKMSPESIEKVRQVHLGRKDSPEVCEKRRLANFGKKRSLEFREYRRSVMLGTKQSEETIRRRFKNSYGSNHHSAVLIFNPNTGIYYDTIKEASKSVTHISYKNISRQLKGDRKMNNNPFIYALEDNNGKGVPTVYNIAV